MSVFQCAVQRNPWMSKAWIIHSLFLKPGDRIKTSSSTLTPVLGTKCLINTATRTFFTRWLTVGQVSMTTAKGPSLSFFVSSASAVSSVGDKELSSCQRPPRAHRKTKNTNGEERSCHRSERIGRRWEDKGNEEGFGKGTILGEIQDWTGRRGECQTQIHCVLQQRRRNTERKVLGNEFLLFWKLETDWN